MTQEQLAEKAEISYKYYQAIEEGRKLDLRLSTLIKLAKAYNLTLSRLLETPAKSTVTNKHSPAAVYASKKSAPKKAVRKKKSV